MRRNADFRVGLILTSYVFLLGVIVYYIYVLTGLIGLFLLCFLAVSFLLGHNFTARIFKSCLNKSRYSSLEEVNKSIQDGYVRKRVKLRSYKCLVCLGYHITSQQERSEGKDDDRSSTNIHHNAERGVVRYRPKASGSGRKAGK